MRAGSCLTLGSFMCELTLSVHRLALSCMPAISCACIHSGELLGCVQYYALMCATCLNVEAALRAGQATLRDADDIKISPDGRLVAVSQQTGNTSVDLRVYEVDTFAEVMVMTYDEGCDDFQWAADSKTIITTVGQTPTTVGTQHVCVGTGEVTLRQGLGWCQAWLSAHGEFVAVQPHMEQYVLINQANAPPDHFFVMSTTTGAVPVQFDRGSESPQHSWHSTDDDILIVISHMGPESTSICFYSMSRGAVLRTVESPLANCSFHASYIKASPANDIAIFGDLDGQRNVVSLVDHGFCMPSGYVTFEQERVDRRFTFSPDGCYVAVMSLCRQAGALKTAKAEVYDVSSSKLRFTMSTEVNAYCMRGWLVSWMPNSQHVFFTLVPTSDPPVVASPGRQLPASAQGLYIVSTVTWKKSAPIPCRGSRAAIQCLPDCSRFLWCNGERSFRAVYSLMTFAE